MREITYNWVVLSGDTAVASNYTVNQWVNSTVLRTEVFNRENYHGSTTSKTLASGRIFTLTGIIFSDTASTRDTAKKIIDNVIKPVWLLWDSEFNTLTWKDEAENQYKAQAKVYRMPSYSKDLGTGVINFDFDLYVEDSTYQGNTDETESWSIWQIGGMTLPTILPATMGGIIGGITVNNGGNFIAPCRIQVTGSLDNPVVRNTTTGRYYGISASTTDLILDNTSRPFVITDAWVNASGNRLAGSEMILLNPGDNVLVVTCHNYTDDSGVTVTISYNDTYISNS